MPRAGELPAAGLCVLTPRPCPSAQHLPPVRPSGAARCGPASRECRSALQHRAAAAAPRARGSPLLPSCTPQTERREAELPLVLKRLRLHGRSVASPTDVTLITVGVVPSEPIRARAAACVRCVRFVRFSHSGARGQQMAAVLKRWVSATPPSSALLHPTPALGRWVRTAAPSFPSQISQQSHPPAATWHIFPLLESCNASWEPAALPGRADCLLLSLRLAKQTAPLSSPLCQPHIVISELDKPSCFLVKEGA